MFPHAGRVRARSTAWRPAVGAVWMLRKITGNPRGNVGWGLHNGAHAALIAARGESCRDDPVNQPTLMLSVPSPWKFGEVGSDHNDIHLDQLWEVDLVYRN